MYPLISPIIFDNAPPINPTIPTASMPKKEEEEKFDLGVDFSFFTSDDAKDVVDYSPINKNTKESTKKKRKSVAKVDMDDRVDKQSSTTSYQDSYAETSNMLRGVIAQTDQLSTEIKGDIDSIRASKTLKNKYTYITDLSASSASLISTKIQAIKELNNSITQAQKFTFDREKMDKGANTDNDDMRMMDLYSAFVNAPMGVYTPSNVPSIQEGILGVNSDNTNIGGIAMNGEPEPETLTPEQYAMRMEKNPNIDTVVVFDATTGNRYFDVIDKSTGASVPGIPRPDNFLLDDTTIDVRSGIARNRNLDKVWPLVQLNNPAGMIEY